MAQQAEFVKVVVCGDGAVGKTCLLYVFTSNCFPEEYVPTVFDNYQTDVEIDTKNVKLGLWDTAGQDEYDRIRPVSYAGAHLFFVCYSVVFPNSLENIKLKWVPEITHHVGEKKVPMILLGMKEDLRNDPNTIEKLKADGKEPVSEKKALEVMKQTGCVKHMVCSAKTSLNVKEVFDTAIRTVFDSKKKKKGICGSQ